MVLIALAVMVVATIAQHLGLTEAVTRILSRIARCPKCCTFWLVMVVLIYEGYDPLLTAFTALISAYLSLWFAVVLYQISIFYNRLWQRVRK